MQLLRKLIILKPVNNVGKGVIKLESLGGKIKGLINISEPKGNYRLGVRVGYSRLYEYEMNGLNYDFRLDDDMNLSDKIECLVVDNNSLKPVLYGSSDGKGVNIEKMESMFTKDRNLFGETSEEVEVRRSGEPEIARATFTEFMEEKPVKKETDTEMFYVAPKENKKEKEGKKEEVIEKKKEEEVKEDRKEEKEETKEVKKEIIEEKKEEINEEKKDELKEEYKEKIKEFKEDVKKEFKPKSKEPDEDFFNSIKPQLDELFRCYPADKDLMRAVPDSKWVRVNYENDDYYVVGILYNGQRATHICYGVPGVYTIRPKQKSEWLPLDYMDPEGNGYWMIFQDAATGKTIE